MRKLPSITERARGTIAGSGKAFERRAQAAATINEREEIAAWILKKLLPFGVAKARLTLKHTLKCLPSPRNRSSGPRKPKWVNGVGIGLARGILKIKATEKIGTVKACELWQKELADRTPDGALRGKGRKMWADLDPKDLARLVDATIKRFGVK
jgi:hypothetical protein